MSELPKGWVKAELDLVCNKPQQRAPDANEVFTYIDIGSVDRDSKTIKTLSEILGSDAPSRARKIVNKNDIIVSMTRPNLNAVALIPDSLNEQIASTGFDVLKPILVESKWIFAIVKSKAFIDEVSGETIGALYPACKASDIRGFKAPIPPLAEQKRIVEKLDQVLAQVDTIKARLDGIPAILKRFRQSVLAAAVSGKLTEEWRGGTVFAAFKNVGSLITDIRYGTSKKCSETFGRVPVLRIPNIGNGKVLLDNLKYADFDDKELDNLALKEGDLLLIRSNGSVDLVGKLALISAQNLHCLFAGYLIRLRFDIDLVNPKFVALCLQSPSLRQVIELKAKSTSGVNNINTKEISSLEVPVPSLVEQTEIVRLVDQYFAFADTIEKQVKKAQQRVDKLTQSILAKAFRGELMPQDPTDEPADQLLKRIAAARAESEALAKAAKKIGKKK